MLDISKLQYRLLLVDEYGNQHDLKDFISDLGVGRK